MNDTVLGATGSLNVTVGCGGDRIARRARVGVALTPPGARPAAAWCRR